MLNFNTYRKWSIWFKLPAAGLFPLESGRRASPGYFSLENASGRAGHPQGFFSLENGRDGKGPACEVRGTWMKGCDWTLILNDLDFKNKDKTDRVKD